MVSFNEVKETFESKGCQFLVSEEEFNKTKHSTAEKYKYIASCGHEHIVWLNVFKNRFTGVICPKCINNTHIIQKQERSHTNPLEYLDLEYETIKYFHNLVKNNWDVKLTRKGCLADIAIKPINIDSDLWIMVQVKSTIKPTRNYGFTCNNKYPDCMILCICNSDKRIWVLDGNSLHTNKITIGLHKSKYSDYELTKVNINVKLTEFYEKYPKYDFHTITTPITVYQQLEYEYCLHRIHCLSFIDFIDNEKQGLVYDFRINNYKIQEKVGSYQKNKNGIIFSLHKNNGKDNNIRKFQAYKKGDNDFYWLNIPDKKYFYIIPEKELIDREYVDVDTRRSIYLNPSTKDHWTQKYLFDYTNPDIDKIKQIFKII